MKSGKIILMFQQHGSDSTHIAGNRMSFTALQFLVFLGHRQKMLGTIDRKHGAYLLYHNYWTVTDSFSFDSAASTTGLWITNQGVY